ncbi:MAG: hypothetical protein ACRD7E_11240 [Bryobacteraceae bacterium]
MRCRTILIVVSTALLVSSCATDVTAQSNYLPLAVNNKWELRLKSVKDPMVFEVVGEQDGSYRVRWRNPWIEKVEYYLRPAGDKVLLTALDMGEGVGEMPEETVYFDFGAPKGKKWKNDIGTYTVVSKDATVSAPAGKFTGCVHIRLTHPDKVNFDWFFAPNVGFVQFGDGVGAYVLASATTLNRADTNTGSPEPAAPATTRASATSGGRILGVDINMAEDGDYDRAFALASSIGMSTTSLTINWDDVEKSPSKFTPNPNWFNIANQYYPPRSTKVDLILSPMDPAGKRMPADLKKLPMNDPKVIGRFQKFLDYAFSEMPNVDINFLAIGNEVDLGIASNKTLWKEFDGFCKAVVDYVRKKKPALAVGVPGTLYGMTGSAKAEMQAISKYGNIILVTYYPIKEDFTVKDPSVVSNEISAFMSAYPGKPVAIVETGYPTASSLGSSESKQSQFIREVFKAWDEHEPRLRSVVFSWLTDLPTSAVESYSKYYSLHDKKFKDYLRTLGLRTYSSGGKDKSSFQVLKSEAAKRQFVR